MLSTIYQKILGIPFVYDKVRPALLGGLDLGPFYDQVPATNEDTILDIGCGTGNALDYLDRVASYVGFDTDPLAIDAARRKWKAADYARFSVGECQPSHVRQIEPTRVLLCGVLHHLPDDVAIPLLRSAAESRRFATLHTLDVAYFDGARHFVANRLAAMDRGKFVRRPDEYTQLVARAGLRVLETRQFWNHRTRRMAKYFTMHIKP